MGRAKDPKSDPEFLDGYEREEEFEAVELEDEREVAATPPAEDAPPTCPRCGWRNTRRSHSKGLLDLFLRTFSMRAFRCRTCGNRFRVMRKSSKS